MSMLKQTNRSSSRTTSMARDGSGSTRQPPPQRDQPLVGVGLDADVAADAAQPLDAARGTPPGRRRWGGPSPRARTSRMPRGLDRVGQRVEARQVLLRGWGRRSCRRGRRRCRCPARGCISSHLVRDVAPARAGGSACRAASARARRRCSRTCSWRSSRGSDTSGAMRVVEAAARARPRDPGGAARASSGSLGAWARTTRRRPAPRDDEAGDVLRIEASRRQRATSSTMVSSRLLAAHGVELGEVAAAAPRPRTSRSGRRR